MSNYIGARCPVCNKKFIQSDDVVVCPICGAPHHRGCYAENSACAFVSEHITGKEWRAPAPEPQHTAATGGNAAGNPGVSVCPACNSANPKGMIFCQICGRRMSQTPPPPQPGTGFWGFPGFGAEPDPVTLMYGGVSPDDKIEDESVRDIAVYVGENSAYYLPQFKIMDETSRTITFNFSALIFSFFYFFYRKMYLIGALLLVFFAVGMVPKFLETREVMPQLFIAMQERGMLPNILNGIDFSEMTVDHTLLAHYQSLANVTSSINFMISLVMSFCANRFYQMKVVSDVKKIRQNRAEPLDELKYNEELASKGGVSRAAVIAVVCLIGAAYFVIGTVLSYQFMEGLLLK